MILRPLAVTNNRGRPSTRTNLFQTTTTEHDEDAYDGVEEITIANLLKHDAHDAHHDEHDVDKDHETKSERSFKSGHDEKISMMKMIKKKTMGYDTFSHSK